MSANPWCHLDAPTLTALVAAIATATLWVALTTELGED